MGAKGILSKILSTAARHRIGVGEMQPFSHPHSNTAGFMQPLASSFLWGPRLLAINCGWMPAKKGGGLGPTTCGDEPKLPVEKPWCVTRTGNIINRMLSSGTQ